VRSDKLWSTTNAVLVRPLKANSDGGRSVFGLGSAETKPSGPGHPSFQETE
jgi:hypothetical protein